MKPDKDYLFAIGFRLFCFAFVLAGAYLWTSAADGTPMKAVGLAVSIVGIVLALIARFMSPRPPF
jgi:hypothetical protein